MNSQSSIVGVLVSLAATLPGAGMAGAAGELVSHARLLSSYTNEDGKAPDGSNDANDDTAALTKALGAGPGVVYVGPGFYRWGNVTIPSGVSVVGAGAATVVRSSGPSQIFRQSEVHEWALKDLVLEGEAQGDWHKREDKGQSGVLVSGCWGYEMVGVAIRNFSGAGLQIERSGAGWANGGNLDRITAIGNAIGIRFDVRAEYINANALGCYSNVVGCVIHAGNAKITGSNFTTNIDGILIQDKENGSHGSISNSLVNHNERYALLGQSITNGMAISDCCFFYGSILLENCVGVNVTDGIIGCSVKTAGNGANRFAGNYVIPKGWNFEFTPVTIVKDNFTAEGPWDKNK